MSDKFYKENPDDAIWKVATPGVKGQFLFSFDKKKIFNIFEDYPWKLTAEQKRIFDKQFPYWAEFFRGRSTTKDETPRFMTFDAAPSHRRFDENGFMHVDSSHITKEQVVKYYGREIPGWRELGLDPERLYNVYRPGDEIEKAAATFDGLPLQLQHHIDSADEPQTEFRVGSISRPVWRAPYLDCDLHITNGAAISAVEHGDFKEISAAYLYEPVVESGEFDGTPYEIVMRNLRGNHVALVPKGRAGADVVVADEAPDAPPLRSFAAWMRKNPFSLKDAPSPEWEATRNALDNN